MQRPRVSISHINPDLRGIYLTLFTIQEVLFQYFWILSIFDEDFSCFLDLIGIEGILVHINTS